jgi:hypothetical protein
MWFGENPHKVYNIVYAQMDAFREKYRPVIQDLPNLEYLSDGTLQVICLYFWAQTSDTKLHFSIFLLTSCIYPDPFLCVFFAFLIFLTTARREYQTTNKLGTAATQTFARKNQAPSHVVLVACQKARHRPE